MHKLRQRLQREEGFTLIELLVVIVIIGILLAIAVPSYLGFRDRAADSAAQANVRAAVPSAEAYFADNGNYAGMTTALPEVHVRHRPQDRGWWQPRGQAQSCAGRRRDLLPRGRPVRDSSTEFHFTGPGGEVIAGSC